LIRGALLLKKINLRPLKLLKSSFKSKKALKLIILIFLKPPGKGVRCLFPFPSLLKIPLYKIFSALYNNLIMKKAGRIKIRKAWSMNPMTRVKKSKKIYSRKKFKKGIENETEIWNS